MSKMAVERASCLFVAVDVLVERLAPHLFQRLLGEPVADLLGAPRFIADLGLDDASVKWSPFRCQRFVGFVDAFSRS